MKHRHKMHKAKGGAVYYEGGESEVAKEAKEKEQRKHGGRIKHMGKVHGEKSKHRLDKKARGGKVHEKAMHKGKEMKYARGGKVGSDKSPMAPGSARHPFSSAAK